MFHLPKKNYTEAHVVLLRKTFFLAILHLTKQLGFVRILIFFKKNAKKD